MKMRTGAAIYKAAEFLLEQLWEEEKASSEIARLANLCCCTKNVCGIIDFIR